MSELLPGNDRSQIDGDNKNSAIVSDDTEVGTDITIKR